MLGEKLAEALAKKSNDVNSFVWKGKKTLVNGEYVQTSVKMMDCSKEDLQSFLKHCNSMLNNTKHNNLGRNGLLELIAEQRAKCNAELFLRWLEEKRDTPRYIFISAVRNCLDNNPQINSKQDPIKCVVGGCPKEFEDINIDLVLDACLDTLGYFSKQHITQTFLLKQGIWFTSEENKEFSKSGVSDKLEWAINKLGLRSNVNFIPTLKINPKGLTFSQMQAMLNLRSKKYSELTTLQLETLRNRILFSLENVVRVHIDQWTKRINQIEQVMKAKGYM